MLKLVDGINFNDYLKEATYEQRVAFDRYYKNTSLSEKTVKDIQEINSEVIIVIFSENFCPDSRVTLPFIKKMQEINNNIKVYIFPRSGYLETLRECTGEVHIPTVMTFNKYMETKGIYLEMPEKVKDMIFGSNISKRREVISNFRLGRYNEYIEQQLLNIIK